jgi:transcriptional regulator with XRE-family HTH domain
VTGDSSELARTLLGTRTMKGLSLRAIAEPAGISPTYLQKLERGDVQDPSPNILYRLSEQLGLDYSDLMGMAGYVVPVGPQRRGGARRGTSALSQALSSEPLTGEEETALTEYLGFLRSKKSGPPSGA